MKENTMTIKNDEEPRDLIVLWPVRRVQRRRRWYELHFGITRWQLGNIGPHKIFALQIFLGPFYVLTG